MKPRARVPAVCVLIMMAALVGCGGVDTAATVAMNDGDQIFGRVTM